MKGIPENTELILFDLGGVVINIEWQRSVHAFADLTGKTFEELNHLMREKELVQKIETGFLQAEAFRDWFRNEFQRAFKDEDIDRAWNAMLRDIPKVRIDIIKELAKSHKVMCLSNTNQIHIDEFNSILKRSSGHNNLEEIMHKTYYSHKMKTRKPARESWEIILNENHLEPDSVLYFDDNQNNHQVALELGLNSVLVTPENSIERYFNE